MLLIGPTFAKENEETGIKSEIISREIAIVASDSGFYPSTIPIFVGEKVLIYLTSTTNNPSCLMIPEQSIFLSAEKGKISEKVTYFDKKGVVKFSCPNGNIAGEFVVLERKNSISDGLDKRQRASLEAVDTPIKIWSPKDE